MRGSFRGQPVCAKPPCTYLIDNRIFEPSPVAPFPLDVSGGSSLSSNYDAHRQRPRREANSPASERERTRDYLPLSDECKSSGTIAVSRGCVAHGKPEDRRKDDCS